MFSNALSWQTQTASLTDTTFRNGLNPEHPPDGAEGRFALRLTSDEVPADSLQFPDIRSGGARVLHAASNFLRRVRRLRRVHVEFR